MIFEYSVQKTFNETIDVLDIGNTALKAAWADGITLGRTFRYQGERMKKFILSLRSIDNFAL